MARIHMERSGEMEVFARVVREGSFSAAAKQLDLTPSAVSKLIARLEARLGVRLLARTTRALTLTDEGRIFHAAALRVVGELNAADAAVDGGTIRGRLAVSASVPFGTHVLVPAVTAFREKHPDLAIDLSLTDDVVNLLAERADIAFRVGTLPDSALIARKLAESRRVVCASPTYLDRKGTPEVPADLRGHDCLTFSFRRSATGWPFRDDERDVEVPVGDGLQVNNGETMRELALAGAGIARLAAWHVAGDFRDGTLVPLLERFNPADIETISAVHVGGGPVPARVRAFIDHVADAVARAPGFADQASHRPR